MTQIRPCSLDLLWEEDNRGPFGRIDRRSCIDRGEVGRGLGLTWGHLGNESYLRLRLSPILAFHPLNRNTPISPIRFFAIKTHSFPAISSKHLEGKNYDLNICRVCHVYEIELENRNRSFHQFPLANSRRAPFCEQVTERKMGHRWVFSLHIPSLLSFICQRRQQRTKRWGRDSGLAATKTLQNTQWKISEGHGRSSLPFIVIPECSLGSWGCFLNMKQEDDG